MRFPGASCTYVESEILCVLRLRSIQKVQLKFEKVIIGTMTEYILCCFDSRSHKWISCSSFRKLRGGPSLHRKALFLSLLVVTLTTTTLTGILVMLSRRGPPQLVPENVTSNNNNHSNMRQNGGRISYKEEYSRNLFQVTDYSDPKSISMKESNIHEHNENPVAELSHDVREGEVSIPQQSIKLQNQDVQLQQSFLQQPRASIYKNPTDLAVSMTEGATPVEESQNLQATNNNYHDNVPQVRLPGQENLEDHKFDLTPQNLSIAEKLQLSGYKDVWDWTMQETDSPVFWHIPKSGGSTFKDLMGSCHRFILASEAGILQGHANDTDLAIVDIGGDAMNEPSKFVNVDTTHIPGLEKAKRLGLVESRLAEVIVIRHVFDAEQLFNQQQRGRLFAVFRHPLERAVSMFNYLKKAQWEPTYSSATSLLSLREYAESNHADYNWLTRELSGAKIRNVTEEHLKIAMDVVRRKILVGLLSKKEETMERFEKYFEWKFKVNPKNQEICREGLLSKGSNINELKDEIAIPGTTTYQLLVSLNKLDLQLYQYIEVLFEEQAAFVKSKHDGYRLEGATCCKCTVPPSCALSSKLDVSQSSSKEIQQPSGEVKEAAGISGTSILMKNLDGYKDTLDPVEQSAEIPVFWHIPKASGSAIKNIMGACFRLVLASAAGIMEGHAADTELAIVKIGGDPKNGIEPSRFVNVDTTHLPGLQKAKRLGLVQSGLAEVIVIRHLLEAESLFNSQRRGRVFALFRHPVERSISMFNYIKTATWEPTFNPEIAKMSLEEYVNSRYMEQDWLTRYLSNTMEGPLLEENFEVAKDLVRRKIMVGLVENIGESMERFEKFFRWKYVFRPKVQEECRNDYLEKGVNSNNNTKEQPQPGSPVYELIVHMNKFDIRLYTYIKELFHSQGHLTSNIPDGYRLVNASCCECDNSCLI